MMMFRGDVAEWGWVSQLELDGNAGHSEQQQHESGAARHDRLKDDVSVFALRPYLIYSVGIFLHNLKTVDAVVCIVLIWFILSESVLSFRIKELSEERLVFL